MQRRLPTFEDPEAQPCANFAVAIPQPAAHRGDDPNGRGGVAADDPTAGSLAPLRLALRRYFASRGVGAADLDDMMQEVFLRILRRGAVSDIDNLEAYAMTIGGHLLADRFRRDGRQRAGAQADLEAGRRGVEEIGPERILAGRQALRATTRALLEMPERQRRVFVLRRVEGLAFAEIARRLGISISSAEKDMQSATQRLIERTGGAG